MARKTKADALKTREIIIDTARELFAKQGVAQTTLENIATACNITSGAIYWNFAGKTEVIIAIFNESASVFTQNMNSLLLSVQIETDSMRYLETYLNGVVSIIIDDVKMRQTFEIMYTKCEYIDKYKDILDRVMNCHSNRYSLFTKLYQNAAQKSSIFNQASPEDLAKDTDLFLKGLLRAIIAEGLNDLIYIKRLIKNHIALRMI